MTTQGEYVQEIPSRHWMADLDSPKQVIDITVACNRVSKTMSRRDGNAGE